MIFIALPVLGFSRELPEARVHRMKDVNQVKIFRIREDLNSIGNKMTIVHVF